MDGTNLNCGAEKQESPIAQELGNVLVAINILREEHGRLFTALSPILMQPVPKESASPTKGEPDDSSPIVLTLKEISRNIKAETRAVEEIRGRLEL